ncbi:MAG TPA: class I SAM-dependent methyltransferase [Casimicrobiaceae bacterium]|nr:class I SAM-dependent methyltransferase [Casimicrobiaceae bacterium]
MTSAAGDKTFEGSIPELYDTLMVPLIFEPYAQDIAQRLRGRALSSVLEIAAGTGVVTRALARTLAPDVRIVATDLNAAMIARAAEVGTARPVEWRTADAAELPFADGTFDAVVCQFGAMFFPDKPAAFAQMRRVLRPGGVLLFNVWDRIEDNAFADTVTQALAAIFPADPPRFMARTPHGYHDKDTIARDVAAGGFGAPTHVETVTAQSRARTPKVPAVAYCQGTPLRNEIIARDPGGLEAATAQATDALARRYGAGSIEGKIQAHVVVVERDRAPAG